MTRTEGEQEALVRHLDAFARFLHVAALMNGQVVNVSGLSRDAAEILRVAGGT